MSPRWPQVGAPVTRFSTSIEDNFQLDTCWLQDMSALKPVGLGKKANIESDRDGLRYLKRSMDLA